MEEDTLSDMQRQAIWIPCLKNCQVAPETAFEKLSRAAVFVCFFVFCFVFCFCFFVFSGFLSWRLLASLHFIQQEFQVLHCVILLCCVVRLVVGSCREQN